MFSKIKYKSVKTDNIENIKLYFFTVKLALYSKSIINNLSDTETMLTLVTSEYSCTESAQILLAIYCIRIYL